MTDPNLGLKSISDMTFYLDGKLGDSFKVTIVNQKHIHNRHGTDYDQYIDITSKGVIFGPGETEKKIEITFSPNIRINNTFLRFDYSFDNQTGMKFIDLSSTLSRRR